MDPSRPIVIAGAGIGGLTAALALAARDLRVTVLEKAPRLEEVGAGLQLSPNATRVLIALGLQPALAAHATVPGGVSIMTARSSGEIVRMPLGVPGRGDAPYWLLHRADLQAALLAKVQAHPSIDLRLDSPVSSFTVQPDGVAVGGEHARALIGADGAWSAVRETLFPGISPQFSGLVAWRGTVDAALLPDALTAQHVQLWMGPKAHLVVYPMSSGRQINMVAVVPGAAMAPGANLSGDGDRISAHFAAAHWPARARALIDAVDTWRRWPLFTMPDGGAWNRGPVALLGDASHAMPPFAAQGAGMAIEDAAVLAQCLAAAKDDTAGVPAALARYAEQRRGRVSRVQRTARQSGRIYHLRGPMALARDWAMRALGPWRMQARQDWIYDWTL